MSELRPFQIGDRVRIVNARWPNQIGMEATVVGTNERGVLIELPSNVPWGDTDTWEFAAENVELLTGREGAGGDA